MNITRLSYNLVQFKHTINDENTFEVFSFLDFYAIALKKSCNVWCVLHTFTCILKTSACTSVTYQRDILCLSVSLSNDNVLAKLELNCKRLLNKLVKMTSLSNLFVTIFNLNILLKSSMKAALCFNKTNENTEYNTKSLCGKDLKFMFKISDFLKIFSRFEK